MIKYKIRRVLALLVACTFLPLCVMAQSDGGGTSGTTGNTEGAKTPDSKIDRKKAKLAWKKNRKQQMSDAESKKEYNKKYNTKKTRKRMKKAEKKAQNNNDHKGQSFLVRWWHKIFH
ncbi:MAG: hypothetical protein NT084_09075 [Bacteroidetes bacterium]|nr:hypothetical protein [Bacteroidota bacterium]